MGILSWNSFHPQRPVLYWRKVIYVKCQVSGVCFFARALTKTPSPLAAVALKCKVLPVFFGEQILHSTFWRQKKRCAQYLNVCRFAHWIWPLVHSFWCLVSLLCCRTVRSSSSWQRQMETVNLMKSLCSNDRAHSQQRGYSASFLLLMSNCTIDWMEHGHRLSVKTFIWTVISR